MNISNFSMPTRGSVTYINQTVHAVSLFEIIFAILAYGVLVYFYVKVNNEKEKYSAWTNPKGRVINLVKLLKFFMYLYPVVVILLVIIKILVFKV